MLSLTNGLLPRLYMLAYVIFADMVDVLQARLRRAPHRVLHAHVVLRLRQSERGVNLYWHLAGAAVRREDTTALRLLIALVKRRLGKLWVVPTLVFHHRPFGVEVAQTRIHYDHAAMPIIARPTASTVSTSFFDRGRALRILQEVFAF